MGSRSHVLVTVSTILVAVQFAAACSLGRSGPGAGGRADGSQVRAVPATLEELADKTGCKLQTQTKATELRQGSCRTTRDRYVMLTFKDDKAKQTWLAAAKEWGGTYLIGPRWVIVGTQQNLRAFHEKLGGEIELGDDHGGGAGHQGHVPAATP